MRTIGFVKSKIKETLPFLEDTQSIFSTIVSNLTNIKNNLLSLRSSFYNSGDSFASSTILKEESDKLKALSESLSEDHINDMLDMIESHSQTVRELQEALNDKLVIISQYKSDQSEEDITEFNE